MQGDCIFHSSLLMLYYSYKLFLCFWQLWLTDWRGSNDSSPHFFFCRCYLFPARFSTYVVKTIWMLKWAGQSDNTIRGWVKMLNYQRSVKAHVSSFVGACSVVQSAYVSYFPATIDIFINPLWCMNTQEIVRSQVYYQITWDFFCSKTNRENYLTFIN